MKFKALIFDCDGTLVDSMGAHYASWRDALEPYGMKLVREDFYRHCGTPSSTVIPMLAAKAGVDVDFKAALSTKEELFIDAIDLLTPIDPIVDIANQHRGQLPMAVASGGTRNLVHRQLEKVQIIDWFDTIVTCEDTQRHKPDPDVFLESARRLGISPADCCVYEDGDPGIQAAHSAGMHCVDIRTLI